MDRFSVLITALLLSSAVDSSNILSILPFPSWSHQQPLLAPTIELARRGHNVTVITTNPPKEKIPNLTIIDISSTYGAFPVIVNKTGFTSQKKWDHWPFIGYLGPILAILCDFTLSLPNVKEFIRNADQTHYDVVLLENFMFSCYSGLVHKIGSPPVIGIHTLPTLYPTDWAMGVPINPSYMPETYRGFPDEMSFFERLKNTIYYWKFYYEFEYRIIPMQEEVLRKHFGPEPPSARDFEFNKSLVLLPEDHTMGYAQPLPPNVIRVGPLHLVTPGPLPSDLQRWMDGAEDGVVYFSLGGIMQGKSMESKKRDALVGAFVNFPKLRFLWKYETDEKIPGLPTNVITRKWFPQKDIFGHKNIRLIIMQGGLQSLQESFTYGIPILAIPLFSDQYHNVNKLIKDGVGIGLDFNDINADKVYRAINEILYTNKNFYKENAQKISKIARDQMVPAMDEAIWWIEYVIRHNGARHLRMASLKLKWYQYLLIDVYGFILLVISIPLFVLYIIIKSCKNIKSESKIDKSKKNK